MFRTRKISSKEFEERVVIPWREFEEREIGDSNLQWNDLVALKKKWDSITTHSEGVNK